MPVHDAAGSNQDQRLPPPRPERSQRHPEQLVQGSQSSARPLRVQSKQLPTESQVFEDEVLAGAKRADDPTEEIPEQRDHGKNITRTSPIEPLAKLLILRLHNVLRMDNRDADWQLDPTESSRRFWQIDDSVGPVPGVTFMRPELRHQSCLLAVVGCPNHAAEQD